MPKTKKKFKTGTTCKQAFEAKGLKVFPTVDGEFIVYAPRKKNGTLDTKTNVEKLLESLYFYDYESFALGGAYHVCGDVHSPANEDEADKYFAKK